METVQPGMYRHYKGGLYRVIGTGKHSETLAPVVLYEALYDNPEGKLWTRPVEQFSEEVIVNGTQQPRFTYIDQISKQAGQCFQVVPAVYLMLLRQESTEILMLQRHNTGYKDGMYSFVAGHVDGNETATDALLREAEEEAGIVLNKENVQFVHVMHRFSADSERLDLFFIATEWGGQIENKEPHKCGEINWYPIAELPLETIPYIRHAITSYQAGRYYSEFDERNE